MAKNKQTEISYPVTLSARGVWVRDWLLEYTDADNAAEAIRNALRVHLTLLYLHEDRTSLFSQKGGNKPFPVHLLAPAQLVELPEATRTKTRKKFLVTFSGDSRSGFARLKRLTKAQDHSIIVENALCLHYDLLRRQLRSETFFVRDGKTRCFERVELFVANG